MAIEPRFSDETNEVILDRMLNNITNIVDKRQGSVTYDLIAPAALEFANAYITMDQMLSYAFLNEDMPSDLLTLAASDFGVDRKPAVSAEGIVTFTGPEYTLIPSGTQVRTDSLIYFETKVDATIVSGQISAEVLAVEGGTSGNVDQYSINTMVGPLAGIVEVTNPFEFTDGVDEESDSALLNRVYDKLRKPATSGNVYHYEQWAKEVPGIGNAQVTPIWDGPGTVKVVVIGDDGTAPSPAIVQDVVDHIEEERPIGADVTVEAATEVPINLVATFTLVPGTVVSTVKSTLTARFTEYLKGLAFIDPVVRHTRIINIALDIDGVIDVETLTLNGVSANITIPSGSVAIVGTVTVNGGF